jgi:hypothetical protein
MKTKKFALVIVLFLAVLLSFAEDRITIDDIYGAWVNPDYNEKAPAAKWISHEDGSFEIYNKITDNKPSWTGKESITGSWHDKEGNLWIQFIAVYNEDGYTCYHLSKYSDSGKVWESVWTGARYPEEMSPIGGNYTIHYRQE